MVVIDVVRCCGCFIKMMADSSSFSFDLMAKQGKLDRGGDKLISMAHRARRIVRKEDQMESGRNNANKDCRKE